MSGLLQLPYPEPRQRDLTAEAARQVAVTAADHGYRSSACWHVEPIGRCAVMQWTVVDDRGAEPLALLAHEVMRRLAAVRVLAEAIQLATGGAGDPGRLAERLAAEVAGLEGLGRQLLDGGRGERREDPVDVLATAAQAAGTVRAARQARVALEGAGPLWVATNAVLLRQALENLIENAHRHGGGGPIEVVVRRAPGNAVEVLVMDRGPGMGKAARRRDGHGVGLALVRRFVEETGTRMWTASRAGGGTVVRLELPAERRGVGGSHANVLAAAETEREAG
jgi:signal transduction histidine kinase